jgi:hypothetical protein
MVWAYDRWNVADTQSGAIGYLTESVSTQLGGTCRLGVLDDDPL